MICQGFLSANSIKKNIAQPDDHSDHEENLTVIRNHTLDAISLVMIVAVKLSKAAKIAPHLKSTLARPTKNDRAYPEKLAIVSPSNSVGVMKPSVLFLFVQYGIKIFGRVDKS